MRPVMLMILSGALIAGSIVPAAAQDPKVAAGEKLYAAQKCSMCHLVAGKGNKKNPLDGAGTRLDAAMVKLWLTDPKAAEAKGGKEPSKPAMKSFASLPAADIDALTVYVLSLK